MIWLVKVLVIGLVVGLVTAHLIQVDGEREVAVGGHQAERGVAGVVKAEWREAGIVDRRPQRRQPRLQARSGPQSGP